MNTKRKTTKGPKNEKSKTKKVNPNDEVSDEISNDIPQEIPSSEEFTDSKSGTMGEISVSRTENKHFSVGHGDEMEDSKADTSSKQPIHNGRKLLVLLRTSQCLQFKSLFECLKELLTEVNVEFIEKKGIRLVSIDPGNIAMVHLVVNAVEYFYTFKTVTAGINMAFLYKMIRSLSSGDFMEWRIYEDSPHKLHIELSNNERRTKTINTIKLLDLDQVDISIPHVEFDRVVSMPSAELAKHIREMVYLDKLITIRGTRTTLEFISNGDMASSHITIEPTASGLNWKHSEDVDDIEGTFIVKYLEKFSKVSVDANVEIFLKKDYPLILRYELSIGTLRFVIAPVRS